MKILILARGVPSDDNPLEGCFEWDQAQALKEAGHTPIIMYLDARWRKGHHNWGISKINRDGLQVYSIYGGTTTIMEHLISWKLALRYNEWLSKKLLKKILTDHPDISLIHAHYLRGIHRAIRIAKETKLPIIGTEHLSDMARQSIPKQLKEMASQSYKWLDCLLTVSPFLKSKIKQNFGIDSIVCPNVLGKEFFDIPLKNRIEEANKPFTFVACGSLLPRKDYELLIKGFHESKMTSAQLLIIGDGHEKSKLQSLISQYNLEKSVKLLGAKTKRQIIDILDDADAFVLSSKSETFGVVVIEALSRGVPVVSTRCGGTDGIITEKNGIFVPQREIDSMANALISIRQNINSYDRSYIRENCLDYYSPATVAKKLETIYCSILNR